MEIATPSNLMMQKSDENNKRVPRHLMMGESIENTKSRQQLRLGKNATKQTLNKTVVSNNNSKDLRKSADNDWKVLNVGIFNIHMTTEDGHNNSAHKKTGSRLNETG